MTKREKIIEALSIAERADPGGWMFADHDVFSVGPPDLVLTEDQCAKDGGDRPVFTVKDGRTNTLAHELEVEGPVRLVYRPARPLSCGARAWVETRANVRVLR